MDRAVTSLSPDYQSQRPRKILLPSALNPELLFSGQNSKAIMNKIKENLTQLSKFDKRLASARIEWPNKFTAEIKNLCRVELVQISGVQLGPDSMSRRSSDWKQQNLYTVQCCTFGSFDYSADSLSLYNKVCRHSVRGLE